MFFGKKQKIEAAIIHAADNDFDTIISEEPGVTIVDGESVFEMVGLARFR